MYFFVNQTVQEERRLISGPAELIPYPHSNLRCFSKFSLDLSIPAIRQTISTLTCAIVIPWKSLLLDWHKKSFESLGSWLKRISSKASSLTHLPVDFGHDPAWQFLNRAIAPLSHYQREPVLCRKWLYLFGCFTWPSFTILAGITCQTNHWPPTPCLSALVASQTWRQSHVQPCPSWVFFITFIPILIYLIHFLLFKSTLLSYMIPVPYMYLYDTCTLSPTSPPYQMSNRKKMVTWLCPIYCGFPRT